MITGLRPDTFKNLQLNAGAFLLNFDHTDYEDADALETAVLAALEAGTDILGATRGGGSFQCTPNVRNIEADGKRYEFKGSTIFDSWTVMLTTTLLEVNAGNFRRVLASADAEDTAATKHTVRIRTSIDAAQDYIENLTWVGDTSEGLVLISLKNALNTTGLNFTFTDKGESTMPVEFHAHQESVQDMQYAPCEIVFFDRPA